MSENRVVNALVEALDNSPNGNRTPETVAKLLVRCQRCERWQRACTVYDAREWLTILITAGRECRLRG